MSTSLTRFVSLLYPATLTRLIGQRTIMGSILAKWSKDFAPLLPLLDPGSDKHTGNLQKGTRVLMDIGVMIVILEVTM